MVGEQFSNVIIIKNQISVRSEHDTYLSVKFSSTVEKGLADVMHSICVTRGVLQTSKGTTAHLKGTIQTAHHIRCKKQKQKKDSELKVLWYTL